MTEKEKRNETGGVSRREFLKDAGLVVGGAAVGSTILLAACGDGDGATATVTKTVTSTVPGGTTTVTAGEVTKTVTTTAAGQTSFVCPSCTTEFGSLAALQTHFNTEHAGEAPVALNIIKFTVNGHKYDVQVEPTDTLREVLRDQLGLTSIKDMCTGYGACGSCTVIVNGRPILSCMALALACNNAVIETAEGLAEANHPLIEAYIMNHCMQCGYCTPGFVLTAKALLDHNPNPTEEDIKDILGGNICRCGTYPAHIKAVLEVAGS